MKIVLIKFFLFCGVLGGAFSFSFAQTPDNKVNLPDTPLGKIAARWLEAINDGDAKKIEFFVENNFSTAALKEQSATTRTAFFRKLHQQSGGLTIVRVTPAIGEMPMWIVARSKRGNRFARVGMGIDHSDLGKLSGLGVDAADDPNEKKMADAFPEPLSETEIIATIRKYVEKRAGEKRFSGVVLIAKDDRVLFHQAYGLSNREAKIRNTPKTKYHLASVGKMFTAASIARLVKEGKLSFEDTVGKILPDFPNEAIKKITIHQLLTHSAGMGTFFESPGIERGKVYPNSMAEIEVYKDEKLFFVPGARWRYSNAGFSLLGAIIERVSGKTYDEYVRENVFRPLGMSDETNGEVSGKSPLVSILYTQSPDDPLGIEPYRAVGGMIDQIGTGFGGGYANTGDLFKFARAYRTGKLLGAEMSDILATGKVVEDERNQARWGYGIKERTINGEIVRGHSGGGRTDLQMLWNSGYTVIIQTNQTPPPVTVVSNEIVAFLTKQIQARKRANAAYDSKTSKENVNERFNFEFVKIPTGEFLMNSTKK
jgi:CubicO group peptidase (beta-lactamase class C family)